MYKLASKWSGRDPDYKWLGEKVGKEDPFLNKLMELRGNK